jgi:sigma-B regulation protein RsbU (phosphoserine phosphatase)
MKADGSVKVLPLSHDFVAGVIDDFQYTEETTLLEKGDTLLLFTDGVTEATSPTYEEYGEQRLEQRLSQLTQVGCQQIIDAIKADVKAFAGEAEQSDDITLLALKRL